MKEETYADKKFEISLYISYIYFKLYILLKTNKYFYTQNSNNWDFTGQSERWTNMNSFGGKLPFGAKS